jgi:hypothetical protein
MAHEMPWHGELLICIFDFSATMFPRTWSAADIKAIQLMESIRGNVYVFLARESYSSVAMGWFYVYCLASQSCGWIHPQTLTRLRGTVHVTKTELVRTEVAVSCNHMDARFPGFDSDHVGTCICVVNALMNHRLFWNTIMLICRQLTSHEALVVVHCRGGKHRSLGMAYIVASACRHVGLTSLKHRFCKARVLCYAASLYEEQVRDQLAQVASRLS